MTSCPREKIQSVKRKQKKDLYTNACFLFMFTKCFILIRVKVELEPIWGTTSMM